MSTNSEPISEHVFYRQGDVELSIAPERVLSYSKDGRTMRKTFGPGHSDRYPVFWTAS